MNEEQVIAGAAKDLRGELLLRLEGASSTRELSEFQVRLKDEIIRAEERRKGDRHNVDLKNHIRRLRLLGDSLAWKLLHAHAIRNLAKNDGRPPALCDRKLEVEKCIATAHCHFAACLPK